MRTVKPDVLTRFRASYIVKMMPGVPLKLGPCHVWQGSLSENGYALFSLTGGRHSPRRAAHCVIYEVLKGKVVPKGYDLDHLCRVRACVNLDHLECVTHRVNIFRGVNPQASHCTRGHRLPVPTLGVKRRCNECRLLNQRAARERRRLPKGTDGSA